MPGFDLVIIGALVLSVAVGLLLAAGSGRAYEQIGAGGLDGGADSPASAGGTPAPSAVADEEIRQMIAARNARRVARGDAPLDAQAEIRRLTSAAAPDPALREEVRQLVEATNARRIAGGRAPLDVDTETDRRLRALGGA